MKIRIKFRKYGVMKFIGHLDIMRYFQKAMRRAEIAICYSEGFSPHQIMSFAAPLGVGITSDGEYLDIEVQETRTTAESIKALNDTMVEGIEITGFVKLPDKAKTAMSIVAAADYTLFFKDPKEIPATAAAFKEGLRAFFQEPHEVLITKHTKKSEKTIDLKQLVYEFNVKEEEGKPVFNLMLSTGSTDNLKPELVLQSLFASMKLEYQEKAIGIHRKDVYAAEEAKTGYRTLESMGEVIV